MNFYRVALLVTSLTVANAAACSSCAKDDSSPAPVPENVPPSAPTDRKAAPLPEGFVRRTPTNLATVPQVVVDSGPPDATTTK